MAYVPYIDNGEDFTLTSDMVLISLKQKEGYASSSNSRTCVVLDTELTDDLIETYDMIASKRGALSKGGVADYDKVSRIILQDLKQGAFGPITFDRLDTKE